MYEYMKKYHILSIIYYCFAYNKLRKLKGGFILDRICEHGCLKCGVPIYQYECYLLDAMCPKCYEVYYKELIKEGLCLSYPELLSRYNKVKNI